MKPRKSCKVCKAACRKNQRVLFCDLCKVYVHQKCTYLTTLEYDNNFSKQNCPTYFCKYCSSNNRLVNQFPQNLKTSTHNIEGYPNSYHSIKNLNDTLQCKVQGDLFVLHFNIVSSVTHVDSLDSMICKMRDKPDIICISESRLKDQKIDWQTILVSLPDYKLRYHNSKTDAGGVAMYIKDSINFEVKSELQLNVDDDESYFIEIEKSRNLGIRKTTLIGCVYRHPRWATSIFLEEFYKKLSAYTGKKNSSVMVVGDFNIDALEKNSRSQNYINTLSSIGCENLVQVPTCFSQTSQSCLDHVHMWSPTFIKTSYLMEYWRKLQQTMPLSMT